jgi:hypothetical protein
MCITWEVVFTKCAHTKQTDVHLYCYRYRHTRTCEVEEVIHIYRKGVCDICEAWEKELGVESVAREYDARGR